MITCPSLASVNPNDPETTRPITELLQDWHFGADPLAAERLLSLVYGELRRLAAAQFRRESAGHTLQPTALVHEAYLRLAAQRSVDWVNRTQFFAIAARIMRRILVDHARSRGAAKRGGPERPLTLDAEAALAASLPVDVLDLDRALGRLQGAFPRPARIVELRFFAGLECEEIGQLLDLSDRTVKRDWAFAKAWLLRELGGPAA